MSETQEAMNKLAVMQAEEIVKLNSRLTEAEEIIRKLSANFSICEFCNGINENHKPDCRLKKWLEE